MAGKEAVQLYLSAPSGKLSKPTVELRAFGKTKQLRPGEQQTMEFTLKGRDLCSFDPEMQVWMAEPGTYTVKVGPSSAGPFRAQSFALPASITIKLED